MVLSIAMLAVALVGMMESLPPLTVLIPGIVIVLTGSAIELTHYRIIKRAAQELGSPDQLVSSGGLLARVRHPMYLGDLIMATGLLILGFDLVAFVIYLLLAATIFGLCHQEDRMMADRFPGDFPAWRDKTWRVIPGLY